MDKKKIEHDILNLVYDAIDYDEIIDSECPDFRIKNKVGNTSFGVEVTEFYFSESNARINKIPNYFTDILNNNQYRHKDDKQVLEVVDFEITEADGTPKGNARGIFQELPQPSQYVDMIVDAILNKDKKIKKYAKDLSHINLLVFDTEHRFQSVSVRDFFRYFFTPQLSTILYDTDFREIFLITLLETNRRVYIPLKMLLLLANFYMFRQLILDYPWETTDDTSHESTDDNSARNIMMTFASYMRAKTSKVLCRDEIEQVEVMFGKAGIVLDGKRINIRDHNDYPMPLAQTVDADTMTSFFSGSEFKEKEQEIIGKFVFSAELAYDIKGDWQF